MFYPAVPALPLDFLRVAWVPVENLVDDGVLSKPAGSRQMQDLRCVVRQAVDGNKGATGVQSQEPEAESELGQGQYQVSIGGTGTVGRKQGWITSQSQQQRFRNNQGQQARSGYG